MATIDAHRTLPKRRRRRALRATALVAALAMLGVGAWIRVRDASTSRGVGFDPLAVESLLVYGAALILILVGAVGIRGYLNELRAAAATDGLTGLVNRRQFGLRVTKALGAARRAGGIAAVVVIDLDRFKDVNDTLGHSAGDELLRDVGGRLANAVRGHDTVARLGGDEFAILIPKGESREHIAGTVKRVIGTLEPDFTVAGVPIAIRASAGIALAPEHGLELEGLLEHADVAMYESKRTGNGPTFYRDDLRTFGVDRLHMIAELRTAIEQDQLDLEYQPKVNLTTGVIDGVEALVRWDHPQRGRLCAAEFVPLAETAGLARALTARVVMASLAQIRGWLDEGLELQVAVNLSPRCMQDLETVELTRRGLARWEVPARLLKFEVTEGSLVGHAEKANDAMSQLQDLGVALSIDDFGTGYSSLAHLKTLPIREIKIDRAFLQVSHGDEADRKIVRAAIELGRQLGVRIVAEGVEHPMVVHELLELGCDAAQGYFFGRPMTATDLVAWLRSLNPQREPATSGAEPGR